LLKYKEDHERHLTTYVIELLIKFQLSFYISVYNNFLWMNFTN